MTELELKLCPFCGSDGLLMRECNLPDEEWVQYYIQCNSTPCGTYQKKYFTREDAIAKWNARTPDEKYKKAIEFIKNMIGSAYDRGCHEQYVESQELLRELGESSE